MTRYDFMGPHEIITRHTRPRTRGRRTAPLNYAIETRLTVQTGGAIFLGQGRGTVAAAPAEQTAPRPRARAPLATAERRPLGLSPLGLQC